MLGLPRRVAGGLPESAELTGQPIPPQNTRLRLEIVITVFDHPLPAIQAVPVLACIPALFVVLTKLQTLCILYSNLIPRYPFWLCP